MTAALGLRADWLLYSVIALTVLALEPAVVSLWHFWLVMSDYQFGFMVGGFCVFWLCRHIHGSRALPLQPDWRWTLLLALALLSWGIAWRANSEMIQQLLLPPILWLALAAVGGTRLGLRATQPIAMLWLAMPWWEYLVPYLQSGTVLVTEGLLRAAGIPVRVNATLIAIPAGVFEIADGCAGKRYFMVAIAMAAIASAWYRLPLRRRLLLLGIAASLGLVTNWLRVITIIIAGQVSHMRSYLVAKEHLTFGTVLFGAMMLLLALIVAAFARGASSALAATSATDPGRDTRVGMPAFTRACVSLLPLVALAMYTATPAAQSGLARLQPLPLATGDWQGPLPADPSWWPNFVGASDTTRAAYRADGDAIEVFAAVYAEQAPGRELIFYANQLLAPGLWRPGDKLAADDAELHYLAASHGQDLWVIGYIYKVGAQVTTSDIVAQLSYGVQRLAGHPAGGVVALALRCATDCEAARRSLSRFWREYGGELRRTLPRSFERGQS